MDKRLQELLDHHEIRKTLSEYCHGCDRLDEARMAGAYANDSWDNHGPIQGTGQALAARVIRRMRSGVSVADTHMLGQSLIHVQEHEAGADTYFMVTSRRLGPEGTEVLNQMGGRYVDTLVQENGRWKIKTRICVHDWSISYPIEGDWLGREAYVQGQRSNDDPSFAALGISHSEPLSEGQ